MRSPTNNGGGDAFANPPSPRSARSLFISRSKTRSPALAICAAICAPMVPAPRTAAFRMIMELLSHYFWQWDCVTSGMKTGISLCMIVKNEQDWIEGAVESVRSLLDEVLIVDTGSTDSTLDRIRRFDPRIINFQWTDSFAEARNAGLEAAVSPWIPCSGRG